MLGSHKLVVSEDVITRDYETALNIDGTTDIKYSGFYQLSRITKDLGSRAHDDHRGSPADHDWLRDDAVRNRWNDHQLYGVVTT